MTKAKVAAAAGVVVLGFTTLFGSIGSDSNAATVRAPAARQPFPMPGVHCGNGPFSGFSLGPPWRSIWRPNGDSNMQI